MSGLAEKNVRTSRKISGLALFKSASPMDYQSIKSAVHPALCLINDSMKLMFSRFLDKLPTVLLLLHVFNISTHFRNFGRDKK